MPLSVFLQHNIPLLVLLALLLMALIFVEYKDSGRGARKLSIQEAIRFMNQRKSLVLDLRTLDQFQKGHIAEAKHIPPEDLRSTPHTFIKKPDLPILLIDEYGTQAASTAALLKAKGYPNTCLLEGGMQTWRKENLPLESNHS
jgi:rhodanese-related sulfurtransferase